MNISAVVFFCSAVKLLWRNVHKQLLPISFKKGKMKLFLFEGLEEAEEQEMISNCNDVAAFTEV